MRERSADADFRYEGVRLGSERGWAGRGWFPEIVPIRSSNLAPFSLSAVTDMQGSSIVVDVSDSSTVGCVRLAAESRSGVAALHSQLRLTSRGGMTLNDAAPISQYELECDSTLQLCGKIRGGGSLI